MHRRRHFYISLTVVAAVLCTMAVVVAPAGAATAAAVDEYIAQQAPSPLGTSGGGGSGSGGQQGVAGQNTQGGTAGTGSAGTQSVGGTGGSLPFTGYPMTTVVWIALALVLAGFAIRLGFAGYRKFASTQTA